jgi:tRNA1Val (adenine37-N6)-methyltransferase
VSLEPGPDERCDLLSKHRRVLQRRRGHRSGTDDTFAAWIAGTSRPDAQRVLDLGCGHGTVTMLLSQVVPGPFTSVEVQAISAALARRNVALNALGDRVTVVESDLRDLALEERFELATGTPPFMPVGSGPVSADPQRAAARFELRGGVEAYAQCAARHLEPGGTLMLLMDGAQDDRCRRAFADAGFGLSRLVAVTPRPGKPVRFRGYVGRLGEPDAATEWEPVLVRDAAGEYTPQMMGIRRDLFLEFPR